MITRRPDGKLVYRSEPFKNYYGDTVVTECLIAEGSNIDCGPRKEASQFCESGKRDYCTCDVCF